MRFIDKWIEWFQNLYGTDILFTVLVDLLVILWVPVLLIYPIHYSTHLSFAQKAAFAKAVYFVMGCLTGLLSICRMVDWVARIIGNLNQIVLHLETIIYILNTKFGGTPIQSSKFLKGAPTTLLDTEHPGFFKSPVCPVRQSLVDNLPLSTIERLPVVVDPVLVQDQVATFLPMDCTLGGILVFITTIIITVIK